MNWKKAKKMCGAFFIGRLKFVRSIVQPSNNSAISGSCIAMIVVLDRFHWPKLFDFRYWVSFYRFRSLRTKSVIDQRRPILLWTCKMQWPSYMLRFLVAKFMKPTRICWPAQNLNYRLRPTKKKNSFLQPFLWCC